MSNKLNLIVAEDRPQKAGIWREAFTGVSSADVLEISPSQLRVLAGLDAILLTGWLAHERYGGVMEPGVSQVLATNANSMPPWVVTLPSTPAKGEWQQATDGNLQWENVKEERDFQELYNIFSTAFTAIKDFNNIGSASIIVVGFFASLLNDSPEILAGAMKLAYLSAFD